MRYLVVAMLLVFLFYWQILRVEFLPKKVRDNTREGN